MTAHPVWFKDDSGKWSQINGVTDWVIVTPLVARGTYRNTPPAMPAAAAGAVFNPSSTEGTTSAQIAGGVAPTVTPILAGSDTIGFTISADSSISKDDNFLQEVLRYAIGPEPIILFKTSVTGSPALPDATTYSTDRPAVPSVADGLTSGGKFGIITGDCVFPWTKNCGLTNTPPQGWVVFTGA